MRTRTLVLLATLTATVALQAQPPASRPTLIQAGRMVDTKAGVYRTNQGIWIEAGRIRQVGAFDEVRSAAPNDVAVIDLGRAAVLPGLIDCHAHLLSAMDPGLDPVDNLILTLTKDSAAKRALLGAAMAREILDGGFTTVRNVGHSSVDGDVSLRDAIQRGWLPGPRIAAAGRKIAPYGGQALSALTAAGRLLVELDFLMASNAAEGRQAVLENVRVGADVIKVVADDGPRVIDEDTMKAIVDEAHRAGLRVAVHAMAKAGVQSAIAGGVDSIEHGDSATAEQFQAMRAKGIVYVPTLWPKELLPISRSLARLPNIDALVDRYIAGERAKLDLARRAGVKIAFGSDSWFGFPGKTRGVATRQLLESLQTSFGMTAAEALKSATVSAAELLNLPDVSGAIEAGKFADLIAVDGDPLTNLADLEKLTFVMKGGAVVRDDVRSKSPQS